MKNFFLLISALINLFFTIEIIGQTVTFQYLLSSTKDYYLLDLLETSNHEIFFVGNVSEPDSYYKQGFVIKLNSEGFLLDSLFISDSTRTVLLVNILKDKNNKFILNQTLCDTFQSQTHSSIRLSKMDNNLNIFEKKEYFLPVDYSNFFMKLRRGKDSSLLIISTIVAPVNKYRMAIYKFNSEMDSLRAKFFINDAPPMIPMDIKELNNGNFWILRGVHPKYAKVDSAFNFISGEAGYTPHYMNEPYGIKWDTDSSFYLAGDYIPELDERMTDHDIGFTKQFHPFDSTGNFFNSWGVKDTVDFPAFFGALDYQNKDSIFIGGTKNLGYSGYFALFPSWFVLIQTDSMLNIRWERFYGGDAYYNMTKVVATNDGGCIMAGTRFDYLSHPDLHKRDIFILKVNSEGLLTTSGGKPSPLVHNAIVFPNPGSDVLRVRVGVQYKQSRFRLADMNGRVVLERGINGKSAVINTAFLPKGTYVYTVTGENGLYESGKWIKE